jgi:hypothetical protein
LYGSTRAEEAAIFATGQVLSEVEEGGYPYVARIKTTLFLSLPQEVPPLHSFYTTQPHFAVALIFKLPQSACSQERDLF